MVGVLGVLGRFGEGVQDACSFVLVQFVADGWS